MFFLISSIVMLVGVLIGFAPTFFVRGAYHADPLPWWLTLHGVVNTAWFVLLPVQSALIVKRRRDWHRWLGWATAVVGLLVVATTPIVIVRAVPRGFASGLTFVEVAFVTIIGMLRVPYFLGCVGAGVLQRAQPATHKRAMLMASLSNFAPATSRMATMVGLSPVLGALAYTVLFGIALVRYDRATLRRVHPWSRWGLVGLFAMIAIPIVLVVTGAAHAIVDPLR